MLRTIDKPHYYRVRISCDVNYVAERWWGYVDEVFGEIISVYSLEQAIADGVLVEVFKNRWQELSGGKPIVATQHLFSQVSLAALQEIWNEFVDWRKNVMPTLPEEDQIFVTTMNGEKVWLIEDGEAFTMLYPEDY
jgi:hypothetical protein